MPIPQLTQEQRDKALKASLEVRTKRAAIKEDLKAGKIDLASIFKDAKADPVKGKMKVLALLQTQPGIGKIKALDLLTKAGIPENRRAQGLGANQVDKLLASLK